MTKIMPLFWLLGLTPFSCHVVQTVARATHAARLCTRSVCVQYANLRFGGWATRSIIPLAIAKAITELTQKCAEGRRIQESVDDRVFSVPVKLQKPDAREHQADRELQTRTIELRKTVFSSKA
jgi:hypothetical protein